MGRTITSICQTLMAEGIKTPRKKDKWTPSTVRSILTNEKYKGDALLQKTFTTDFLQKKKKVNEGEVPQYYVRDSHPAIISPSQWDEVQVEMARRDALGATYSSKSVFSSKLICEDCGGFYDQKVWHSNSEFKKYIWQCNNKFKGEHKCETPHLKYEEIEKMFLQAYNQLMGNRESVIEDCILAIETLDNTSNLEIEIADKADEIAAIADRVRKLVEGNASQAQDQAEYLRKYNKLAEAHDKANTELQELIAERNRRELQAKQIQAFIERLRTQPLVLESFDETIWLIMIESGTVHQDKSITFKFMNGTKIKIEAE